jgi:putative intracellular protease/amidase
MSIRDESSDELARLLSALADGALDPADEDRLAALLQTDSAARAKYYDHVILAALLRREGRRAAEQGRDQWLRPGDTPRPTVAALSGRARPWLLVLAASILLCLLLSIGEATGVTHLVPTMIRIVTGEGSVIIEVDDPSVSVQLDGEDITISGAGLHELRLRPGTHRFIATKDGQPLREETVTIERGGRRIVNVTRSLPASSMLLPQQGKEVARQTSSTKAAQSSPAAASGSRPSVLMILSSHGFYYPGYAMVRGELNKARVETVVAAPTPNAAWPDPLEPHHVAVQPEIDLNDVRGSDYDALYFCGGNGIDEFTGDGPYVADARRVIAEAIAAGKLVAATGRGPLILADAGLLRGIRATCFRFGQPAGHDVERLKAAGAIWADEPVVVSGPIITGRDPNDLKQFAAVLIQELASRNAPSGDQGASGR